MRLTLRTMLAYLDGLLGPEDSQDIAKKIEDSEFATSLLHRIRDVMRKLRLTAPSLSEKGPGLEPNTVAEYLDNVLPGDRVPDFEKVCLESDVHLAEVAASHQILTLVLGEPAEIDPASRERMYQLPRIAAQAEEERAAAAAAAATLTGGDGAARPTTEPRKDRAKPVVPEYLRQPSRSHRLLPAAALLFLAGGIVGIVLMVLGQFEPNTPLGKMLQRFRGEAETAGPTAQDTPSQGTAVKTPPTGPVVDGARPKPADKPSPGTQGPEAATGSKPPGPGDAALTKAGTATAKPALGTNHPDGGAKPEAGTGLVLEIKDRGKPPVKPSTGPGEKPLGKPSESVAALDPKLTPKPSPSEKPVAVGEKPATVPTKSEPAAEESVRVGRFLSDGNDVLLKFLPASRTWNRVLPEEFLVSRQTLLALPTCRPRIVILNVGVTIELLGGTRVELLPPGPQGPAGVSLLGGRLVVKPLAKPGVSVRVACGPHTGVLNLASVETIAAVEVIQDFRPGNDPSKKPAHLAASLHLAQGEATWEESGGGQPVALKAPAERILEAPLLNALVRGALRDPPKWIQADMATTLDRRASTGLVQAFQAAKPTTVVLSELTLSHRIEERRLAVRSLACLDKCEPIMEALDDVAFKNDWPELVEQIRQAMARSPQVADEVRKAAQSKYGREGGQELYQMLVGYSDTDLEAGQDEQLVKCLTHPTLAFRVVAFCTLRDLTGHGFYYKPELPETKRRQAVERWAQFQAEKRIRQKPGEVRPPAKVEPAARVPAGLRPAGPSRPAGSPLEPPTVKPAAEAPAEPRRLPVPEPSADLPEIPGLGPEPAPLPGATPKASPTVPAEAGR